MRRLDAKFGGNVPPDGPVYLPNTRWAELGLSTRRLTPNLSTERSNMGCLDPMLRRDTILLVGHMPAPTKSVRHAGVINNRGS